MSAAIGTYTAAVIYRVTVKATGETFYAMPTGAGDGSCYQVKAQHGKLVCSCPDCTYRHRNCKHILALAEHLREKRAASIIHQAEQIATKASAPNAPTLQRTRENALPYDSGEGFSIFKPERRYQTLEDEYASRDGYTPGDYYQHAYR